MDQWMQMDDRAGLAGRMISSVLVLVSLGFFTLDVVAQGSTTHYFPHLAVGAGWQTTITYINYSSEEVICITEFLSDQGTPLMVSFAGLGTVNGRDDVLPPGGSVHQETDVDLSAPQQPTVGGGQCMFEEFTVRSPVRRKMPQRHGLQLPRKGR